MAFSEAHVHLKLRLYRLLVAVGLLVGWIRCCSPGSNSHEMRIRPPFVLGQRRPDLHENAGMASGEPQGPISRNSEKFRSQLVRSFDTGIVFRDDENTGADRVMSRRCKSALERLAQLVKDEWEGTVKLRVIDAWDEDGEHTANSLHYEGRALDITTSDLDNSKYGKLASLAFYGAHFDWVQYQTKHVHVSCRTDGPEDQTNQCFPAQGLVRLPNNEVKRLEELKVGDRVLALNDQGALIYSDVIMFLDWQPHIEMVNYISIHTSDPPRQISLTENHLLYISKTTNSSASVQYARQVRTGDFVHVLVSGNEGLFTAKVTLVQRHRLRGAIAPLTSEGTIVVNDVLSSCYASMRDQSFAHWTFLPWRQIYTIMGGMLSPSYQTGVHWYPNILRTLNYILGLYPKI